jgi:hypothetical protein
LYKALSPTPYRRTQIFFLDNYFKAEISKALSASQFIPEVRPDNVEGSLKKQLSLRSWPTPDLKQNLTYMRLFL